MPNYAAGCGNYYAKLMIVGEAPGKNEDIQLQPFVGASGAMLNDWLRAAGISRDECWITNVVKFRPPNNDFSKLNLINIDINQQVEFLWEKEIKEIKPNAILAVGSRAMRAVMGWPVEFEAKKDYYAITNYRGSILIAKDGHTKVIPTIHPAALMNRWDTDSDNESEKGGISYSYIRLIEHDVKRAVIESQTSKLNLPDPALSICHDSVQLYRFIQEYQKAPKAASDIESVNCIPVCVGFAFNKHHAISIPLLRKVGNVKLTDMSEREHNEVLRMVQGLFDSKKLIGHNFKYDEFKLGLFGFNRFDLISDTIIKLRVLFPECPKKRLVEAASYWTRHPYYKDEGKEFRFGKSPISQLYLYNAKDCVVEYEVDEAMEVDLIALQEKYGVPLVDYYYNYQMKKHAFYLRMEQNGFEIDLERKAELNSLYQIMEEDVHDRQTFRLRGELNVKSAPAKAKLLYEIMKFKKPKRSPTSEDAIVKLINSHCKGKDGEDRKDILKDILLETRIRDQKSRYINYSPDYNGTCKSTFNIIATETCRSSTGILNKPIRPKKIGLGFHTISKHGELAKAIRSQFRPRRGKVYVQADASQAEPRVVAVLCRDWPMLEAFKNKIDIHTRTALLIFGYNPILDLVNPSIPADALVTKESPERFCGKQTRNAGNYNMKAPRFTVQLNTNAQKLGIDLEVSPWKAGQMLDLFHNASPSIRDVFHREIIEALDSNRVLIDPFGGVREFTGRFDEDLYKEGFANIPQRTVGHLVQGAALKVEEELAGDIEHMWILEAHDALMMEVPENNWLPYALLLKKHMECPIDFSLYCTLKRDYILTIPADVEISDKSYADLKKVKVC